MVETRLFPPATSAYLFRTTSLISGVISSAREDLEEHQDEGVVTIGIFSFAMIHSSYSKRVYHNPLFL
jgi:hypothetical protein